MINPKPEVYENLSKVRRLISFLGLVLLLLSQLLLSSLPVDDKIVFPKYTWVTVAGLLLFFSGLLIRPAPLWKKLSEYSLFSDDVFWVLMAVAFSALATVGASLFQRTYIPVLSIWLIAGIAYLFTFTRSVASVNAIKSWIKNYRAEIIAVALVMLLAGLMRFYRLGELPRVLDGDEGLIGLAAQSSVEGRLANPFALWENFGALYLQAINIAISLFGDTAFALRLMPAIGGVLAVPAIYLFARQISGRNVALVAAFLLAVSHTHINFSRIVSVAYIHGTWLVPLELYFLLSGFEKRRTWRTALAGVLLAFHFSVYLTAQVITALALVYTVLLFIFYRSWFKTITRAILAFWGGFLIMILPEAYYISKNMNEFLNRLAQNGTFQSGWFERTIQNTGQSPLSFFVQRIVHAFLSLFYYPAFDFYGSPSPMLTVVSSVLVLTGLAICLYRVRRPAYLLLNGYFWATTLSIGIFAIPPSADSYRMLMAFPAALIMGAIGLDYILELIGIGWEKAKNAYTFSTAIVLCSLLFLNVWIYFGDFAGQCRFGGNLEGRFASYLGSYVRTVESDSSIYLLSDSIFFYGSHASTDYLGRLRPVINYNDPIDTLHPIFGETIIASPHRFEELEAWVRLNPGGTIHYQYDCKQLILMAYQAP